MDDYLGEDSNRIFEESFGGENRKSHKAHE
jgi:hypothetical protein